MILSYMHFDYKQLMDKKAPTAGAPQATEVVKQEPR